MEARRAFLHVRLYAPWIVLCECVSMLLDAAATIVPTEACCANVLMKDYCTSVPFRRNFSLGSTTAQQCVNAMQPNHQQLVPLIAAQVVRCVRMSEFCHATREAKRETL